MVFPSISRKKPMRNLTSRANASDTFGRNIGMGLPPGTKVGVGDLARDCGSLSLSANFTQVPVIEYVTWTVELPVSDATLNTFNGEQIDLLGNPKSVPGVTSVDSSFVQNGQLQVDMMVVGFGVHVFGEPTQGSIIGNYIDPTPATNSTPVSPDAFTTNHDAAGGGPTAGALGLATGTTITPAILEWGYPAQNAMWHMVNAFQFQWIVMQRFQLINELAADVAYFGSYAEATGAGSSQEAAQRLVRRTNDKYQAQGATGSFVPVNAQRIGSVTTLTTTNVGVFHPTRAYDLVDMTLGGLKVQGGAGCCQPFRKLNKPVLLERGIPIGMLLQEQDGFHKAEFLRYISQSDNQGGNVARVAFAANAGGTTVSGAQVFPELSLDATAVIANQVVQTDRDLFKGGALQIAILIKGFEVWGSWKDYCMKNYVQTGMAAAPGVAGVTGMGMMPIG